MKNFLIAICLFIAQCVSSQGLVKEAFFFDAKNNLTSIEREYILEDKSALFCHYDGEILTFKYKQMTKDTMWVSWKSLRMGDTNVCFCLYADERTISDSLLRCKNNKKNIVLNLGEKRSMDIEHALKSINLGKFMDYKYALDVDKSKFEVQEIYSYKNNQLMNIDVLNQGFLEYRTILTTHSNKLNIYKYHVMSNQIVSEYDMIWNTEKSIAHSHRKDYSSEYSSDFSSYNVQDNQVYSKKEKELAKMYVLDTSSEKDPLEILKYKVTSTFHRNSIYIDDPSNLEVLAYFDISLNKLVNVTTFSSIDKTQIVHADVSGNQLVKVEIQNFNPIDQVEDLYYAQNKISNLMIEY